MSSNPPVHMHGRRFGALPGDDLFVERVDMSGHFHTGHPATSKVRPALGVQLVTEPSYTGHHGISRLGPSIPGSPTLPFALKSKPAAPLLAPTPLNVGEVDAATSPKAQDASPSPLAGVTNPADAVVEEKNVVGIPVRFLLTICRCTMLTPSRLAKSSRATGAFLRRSTSQRTLRMTRIPVQRLALQIQQSLQMTFSSVKSIV